MPATINRGYRKWSFALLDALILVRSDMALTD